MPSYYTVEVSGIPLDLKDPNVLQKHFEQFGEVFEVNLIKDYGGTLYLHKEENELSKQIEIEKIKIDL